MATTSLSLGRHWEGFIKGEIKNGHQARVGNIGCATCHNVHVETAEGRPDHLKGLHLRMPEFVEPLCADCHGPDSLFLYKFFHSQASR